MAMAVGYEERLAESTVLARTSLEFWSSARIPRERRVMTRIA